MQMGGEYDFGEKSIEELRKKKHPITFRAFTIAYNRRKEDIDEGRPPFYVDVIFDCDGDPVPTSVSKDGSSVFAQSCPGAEWAYPNYTSYTHYGKSKEAGFIKDKRSHVQILLGCCPMTE